jgi:hypothetical protein
MHTYKAKVVLPNGVSSEVNFQADSRLAAQLMLEAQYGKGSVWYVTEVPTYIHMPNISPAINTASASSFSDTLCGLLMCVVFVLLVVGGIAWYWAAGIAFGVGVVLGLLRRVREQLRDHLRVGGPLQ